MQSAGQAAAQSEQPMHFSRPFGMAVQPVAPAEARVHGALVLGIGLRHRTPEEVPQRDGEALEALCLLAPEIEPGADRVFLEIVGQRHGISIRTAPPRRRCTSRLSVASGRSTFQPSFMRRS